MVAKKTAEQQKAALMALMESNQRDLVLDVKEDRPVVRHRHNKHSDVATKPASFRLPLDVLRKLDEYVWSEANRDRSGKPRLSRADVVATALREWLDDNRQ